MHSVQLLDLKICKWHCDGKESSYIVGGKIREALGVVTEGVFSGDK